MARFRDSSPCSILSAESSGRESASVEPGGGDPAALNVRPLSICGRSSSPHGGRSSGCARAVGVAVGVGVGVLVGVASESATAWVWACWWASE